VEPSNPKFLSEGRKILCPRCKGRPQVELTLQEAALLFEVDEGELVLALTALGRDVHRRLVRRDGKVETYYHREDIEDALARVTARQLGFEDPEGGSGP
jgi:hypothetical protein